MTRPPSITDIDALRFLGYGASFRVGDITVDQRAFNSGWCLTRDNGWLIRDPQSTRWFRYVGIDPRMDCWYFPHRDEALLAAEADYERRTGRTP